MLNEWQSPRLSLHFWTVIVIPCMSSVNLGDRSYWQIGLCSAQYAHNDLIVSENFKQI